MTAVNANALINPYRITKGSKFQLKHINPAHTGRLQSKDEATEELAKGIARLSQLQELLYASGQWAVLLIFQAMDAAGKDGIISHVMSGVNPQGCQVYSFKAPSAEELDHDFLWRTTCRLPQRGRIGIFNRSYYEEVLVVRVHPELLARQKLPPALITQGIWEQRFEAINGLERYLTRNGVVIRKFFLHVSKAEQRRRFLDRLEEPEKNWKFSQSDVQERQYWDQYMSAYEKMIQNTATEQAPWFVVPADHKWFTRLVVAEAIIEALESLDLHFPKVEATQHRALEQARRMLLREKK